MDKLWFKMPVICLTATLLLFITGDNYGQTLITYPEPVAGFDKKSDLYQVSVTCGSDTKDSYVYVSRASTGAPLWEWQGQEGKSFHFTTFSFSGTATVSVTKLNSTAASAIIRPDRIGLGTIAAAAVTSGKQVTFIINRSRKISVEFDDDSANKKALLIFADTLETPGDVPQAAAPDVYNVNPADSLVVPAGKSIVRFAPGVYNIGYWRVPPAVTQVYISGGAYVRGYMLANRASTSSLKINGRGIISNDQWAFHYPETGNPQNPVSSGWYKSIVINGGKKHLVEGVTMIDGTSFNLVMGADSSAIRNVKINGFRYNNDGITVAGKDVSIEDCFIRVGDDGIVANGSRDYLIQNCVFWHLRGGSCIQLGWRPHAINGTNLISNCDVIHAEWIFPQTQNSGFLNYMGSVSGNPGLAMENFVIQDIFFDTEVLKVIDLRMNRGGTSYPLNMTNFLFKNIHARIPVSHSSFSVYFSGVDSTHKITGLSFSDFYINDTLIGAGNFHHNKHFKIGNFVDPLTFL